MPNYCALYRDGEFVSAQNVDDFLRKEIGWGPDPDNWVPAFESLMFHIATGGTLDVLAKGDNESGVTLTAQILLAKGFTTTAWATR